MGFLEEGKKSWKGGFSKGGTDLFAVKGLVYTTTSVCLSVRPPVHEILNASALPFAAVASSSGQTAQALRWKDGGEEGDNLAAQ